MSGSRTRPRRGLCLLSAVAVFLAGSVAPGLAEEAGDFSVTVTVESDDPEGIGGPEDTRREVRPGPDADDGSRPRHRGALSLTGRGLGLLAVAALVLAGVGGVALWVSRRQQGEET